MSQPPVQHFAFDGFHRLIPSLYSRRGTVLADLATEPGMLDDLILLDGATNDRIQSEQHGTGGISPYELVYGIPNAHIVNAAFAHKGPDGGRFNDSTRGAWYSAEELDTSVAEVTYHKARRLAQIVVPGLPGEQPDQEVCTYDDWLADFRADFHALEPAKAFARFLQPEPVPECYHAPQRLSRELLEKRSNGIVYPSVRRSGSRCVACFRPALVYNARLGITLEFKFKYTPNGYQHSVRSLSSAKRTPRKAR